MPYDVEENKSPLQYVGYQLSSDKYSTIMDSLSEVKKNYNSKSKEDSLMIELLSHVEHLTTTYGRTSGARIAVTRGLGRNIFSNTSENVISNIFFHKDTQDDIGKVLSSFLNITEYSKTNNISADNNQFIKVLLKDAYQFHNDNKDIFINLKNNKKNHNITKQTLDGFDLDAVQNKFLPFIFYIVIELIDRIFKNDKGFSLLTIDKPFTSFDIIKFNDIINSLQTNRYIRQYQDTISFVVKIIGSENLSSLLNILPESIQPGSKESMKNESKTKDTLFDQYVYSMCDNQGKKEIDSIRPETNIDKKTKLTEINNKHPKNVSEDYYNLVNNNHNDKNHNSVSSEQFYTAESSYGDNDQSFEKDNDNLKNTGIISRAYSSISKIYNRLVNYIADKFTPSSDQDISIKIVNPSSKEIDMDSNFNDKKIGEKNIQKNVPKIVKKISVSNDIKEDKNDVDLSSKKKKKPRMSKISKMFRKTNKTKKTDINKENINRNNNNPN